MRRRSKLLLLLSLATAVVLAVFTLRYVLSPSVTLQGRVTFKGVPPYTPVSFSLPTDPQRSRLLDDESFLLTQDGSLANVLVYIKDGVVGNYNLHNEPVRVEQSNCLFKPRVMGVRVGQHIDFRNKDPWAHNINCRRTQRNAMFNVALLPNTEPTSKVFANAETPPFVLQCDVHRWERAFIAVFNHPYFAVTGSDGTFTFPEKLRPGVYTIVAWHEGLGAREQRVLCFGPKQTILLTIERRTGS